MPQRGNANYAGCNNSISRYQAAQNGQPAQTVQTNFYSAVNTVPADPDFPICRAH